MLGSTVKINPFLRKLLIPFFVITLVLIAADLIISILTAFRTDLNSTSILSIIYLIVSIGFLVFYVVTARRIVIQLRSAEVMKAAADMKRMEAINKVIINHNINILILLNSWIGAWSWMPLQEDWLSLWPFYSYSLQLRNILSHKSYLQR